MDRNELNSLIESAPTDEKGRPVIPDSVFMENLKALPDGVRSDTDKLSTKNGYIILNVKGSARTKARAISGGQATKEAIERRKTFREACLVFLNTVTESGKTVQEEIVEALCRKALEGNVSAFECIRDTIGEKPANEMALDIMTEADRKLIENVSRRLEAQENGLKAV